MSDENVKPELELDEMSSSCMLESDNEEMIKYVSEKLLALEDTFFQHVKSRYAGEEKEKEKDSASPTLGNFNLPFSCLEFIEDMFIELNGINENLRKIIKSNCVKKEKIASLCAKFREMKQLYSSFLVKYELIEEEAKIKENKIEELENLLKSAESDLYIFKHKRDYLDLQKNGSNLIEDNHRYNLVNSQTNAAAKARIELQELKDEVTALQDMNTHLLLEKQEAETQIANLKCIIQQKGEVIEEIRLSLDIEQKKSREMQSNLHQLQTEKNYIKNEFDMCLSLSPRRKLSKKKSTPVKNILYSLLDKAPTEDISTKIRHRKRLSFKYSIDQNNGENLAQKLLNNIPETTLNLNEHFPEEDEENSSILNAIPQKQEELYMTLDIIDITPRQTLEKETNGFDADQTLSAMLNNNLNEEDEPNPFLAMNERNKSKVSLTTSLDNLETGLRSNRTKLQMSPAEEEICNLSNKKTNILRQFTLSPHRKKKERYIITNEIHASFLADANVSRYLLRKFQVRKNRLINKIKLLKKKLNTKKKKNTATVEQERKINKYREPLWNDDMLMLSPLKTTKSTKKIVQFKDTVNEISNKFAVAEQEFHRIASGGSSTFARKQSRAQTTSHKSLMLRSCFSTKFEEIPDSQVIRRLEKSTLISIKEICFKIPSTSENKRQNFDISSFYLMFESCLARRMYSSKVRDMYIKYFKFSHIYFNEALKYITQRK